MKKIGEELIRLHKKIGREVLYVRPREKIIRNSNEGSFRV